jgi:hypothetical protein
MLKMACDIIPLLSIAIKYLVDLSAYNSRIKLKLLIGGYIVSLLHPHWKPN